MAMQLFVLSPNPPQYNGGAGGDGYGGAIYSSSFVVGEQLHPD